MATLVFGCFLVFHQSPGSQNLIINLIDRFKKKSPHIAYREAWGMTETSPFVTASPSNDIVHGSIGKVLPNTEIKIVDVETGLALGPNKDGEICVRGPQVKITYLT